MKRWHASNWSDRFIVTKLSRENILTSGPPSDGRRLATFSWAASSNSRPFETPCEQTFPVRKSHLRLAVAWPSASRCSRRRSCGEDSHYACREVKELRANSSECIVIQCPIRSSLLWSQPLWRRTGGLRWRSREAFIFLLKLGPPLSACKREWNATNPIGMTTDLGYPVTSLHVSL